MKLDTTHGEARTIIVGQLQSTIDMLLRVQQPAENGLKKQVYEGVDFDLLRRLQDNIEAWAERTMNDQPERSEDFHKRCVTLNSSVPASEVAELRKDKARLDWIESECHTLTWTGQLPTCVRGEDGRSFEADTFREAIDAAMN